MVIMVAWIIPPGVCRRSAWDGHRGTNIIGAYLTLQSSSIKRGGWGVVE